MELLTPNIVQNAISQHRLYVVRQMRMWTRAQNPNHFRLSWILNFQAKDKHNIKSKLFVWSVKFTTPPFRIVSYGNRKCHKPTFTSIAFLFGWGTQHNYQSGRWLQPMIHTLTSNWTATFSLVLSCCFGQINYWCQMLKWRTWGKCTMLRSI